jgi:hypothetical protein
LAVSRTGEHVLYQANFSIQKPITTQMKLWAQSTSGHTARREIGSRKDAAPVWHFGLVVDATGRFRCVAKPTTIAG